MQMHGISRAYFTFSLGKKCLWFMNNVWSGTWGWASNFLELTWKSKMTSSEIQHYIKQNM